MTTSQKNDKCIVFEWDNSLSFVEPILDGFRDYFIEYGSGEYELIFRGMADAVNRGYRVPDDIAILFCWLTDRGMIRFVHDLKIPYLNFSGVMGISNVGIDLGFTEIGKWGARFLIEDLGLDSIAVVGRRHMQKSDERVEEFVEMARSLGVSSEVLLIDNTSEMEGGQVRFEHELRHAEEERRVIVPFITKLKKPSGIFCVHDALGFRTASIAQSLGFDLCREVNVVFPSNFRFRLEDRMEVSVIQLDFHKLGYEGARQMMSYLNSGEVPRAVRLLPMGVKPSEKRKISSITDPLARKVLSLIEKDHTVTPEGICETLNVSPATLHRRFKLATHMTLGKAIEDERFASAKLLFMTTGYNLAAIAGLAGYINVRQMRRSVLRYTGQSLKDFRRVCRLRTRD